MSYDFIIICDLELTCWLTKEEQGNQPIEVIEIGACILNINTFDISRKKSYIIRPKFSKVSEFCTELTGYKWDDVKTGIPFDNACNKFSKEFGTRNRVWASWGDCDRLHFEKECKQKKAKYPFGISHINISSLYTLMVGNNKKTSVSDALESFNLKFIGTPHKGCDDAWNTARLMRALLQPTRNYFKNLQ